MFVGPSPWASAPAGRPSVSSAAAIKTRSRRIDLFEREQVAGADLRQPQRAPLIRGPADRVVALDDVVAEALGADRTHLGEHPPEADHVRVRAGTRAGRRRAGVRRIALADVALERVDRVHAA